jgi:GNAT superfamily N-acetyltransferase
VILMRPATAADLPFLRAMTYEAASWRPGPRPPAEAVLADPNVAHYVEGWGRRGDLGLIAEDEEAPRGATWLRLFDESDPGFGFVAADVPELAIAVVAESRGRGVGTALLEAVPALARAAGHRAVSLSVESDNPALRLYERVGFRRVGEAGGAWTMLLELRPS